MADIDFDQFVIDVPNFPTPGVVFKDVTPLLKDPVAFKAAIDTIAGQFADCGVTKVVGSEARGFMIGAPVAYALGVGFVPARKPGKLPRAVFSQSYELEYGTDILQIHADAITPDDTVLLIDDLVATGGTVIAQLELMERFGAKVAGMGFLMELEFLKPRAAIAAVTDKEVFSLIKVK